MIYSRRVVFRRNQNPFIEGWYMVECPTVAMSQRMPSHAVGYMDMYTQITTKPTSDAEPLGMAFIFDENLGANYQTQLTVDSRKCYTWWFSPAKPMLTLHDKRVTNEGPPIEEIMAECLLGAVALMTRNTYRIDELLLKE